MRSFTFRLGNIVVVYLQKRIIAVKIMCENMVGKYCLSLYTFIINEPCIKLVLRGHARLNNRRDHDGFRRTSSL